MTWTWFVLTNSFQNPSAHTDVYIYSYLFIYLVGGFNPSEKYERQLGWWNSQCMEKWSKCSKPPTIYIYIYAHHIFQFYSILTSGTTPRAGTPVTGPEAAPAGSQKSALVKLRGSGGRQVILEVWDVVENVEDIGSMVDISWYTYVWLSMVYDV